MSLCKRPKNLNLTKTVNLIRTINTKITFLSKPDAGLGEKLGLWFMLGQVSSKTEETFK